MELIFNDIVIKYGSDGRVWWCSEWESIWQLDCIEGVSGDGYLLEPAVKTEYR